MPEDHEVYRYIDRAMEDHDKRLEQRFKTLETKVDAIHKIMDKADGAWLIIRWSAVVFVGAWGFFQWAKDHVKV